MEASKEPSRVIMEFSYLLQRIAVRLKEEQLWEVLLEYWFLVFVAQRGVYEGPVHCQRVEQIVEFVLYLIVLWKNLSYFRDFQAFSNLQ